MECLAVLLSGSRIDMTARPEAKCIYFNSLLAVKLEQLVWHRREQRDPPV